MNVERLNVLTELSVGDGNGLELLKTTLLSIKTQQPADTIRFRIGKKFSSHAMKIRNLVGIVRSRRRLGGADRRPRLFQWRTREKVLGGNQKLKCAFSSWAVADFSMWFSYTTVYCALCSCVFRPATDQIFIAKWLSQDVLFEPLPSPREVLSAFIEALTVWVAFACQRELNLWIWWCYDEWKYQNPKSPVQVCWTCLNRPEFVVPELQRVTMAWNLLKSH